jgi:hypothetical protein
MALPALVAVPLGVATWALSRQEVCRIRAGLVDPAGRADAERAQEDSIAGVVLAGAPLAYMAFFLGVILWRLIAG